MENRKFTLISSKRAFILAIIATLTSVLIVWMIGLKNHHTILENAFISTSVLAVIQFLVLTIGFYKGVKLKYDNRELKIQLKKYRFDFLNGESFSFFDGGDGIVSSILLWLFVGIILVSLFWIVGLLISSGLVILFFVMHWVFYRSFRLILKVGSNSIYQFWKSTSNALFHTTFIFIWIYFLLILIKLL